MVKSQSCKAGIAHIARPLDDMMSDGGLTVLTSNIMNSCLNELKLHSNNDTQNLSSELKNIFMVSFWQWAFQTKKRGHQKRSTTAYL